MMILKLIARTVGLHRLLLLDFYPFLQKYIQVSFHKLGEFWYYVCYWSLTVAIYVSCNQPHQRDITNLLAAVVQACHDMVQYDCDLFPICFILLNIAFSFRI